MNYFNVSISPICKVTLYKYDLPSIGFKILKKESYNPYKSQGFEDDFIKKVL